MKRCMGIEGRERAGLGEKGSMESEERVVGDGRQRKLRGWGGIKECEKKESRVSKRKGSRGSDWSGSRVRDGK